MPGYNNIIGRPDVSDAIIPVQVVSEVIKAATAASVIMTKAKRTPLSTKVARQPVLASLPAAYWVDGDTGIKQTDKATWQGLTITAEGLAVIVPIPDAVVDDANIPLWDEVKPLLAEAAGQLIDSAALFGKAKPASWPTAIVPGATAAGNVVQAGTGKDLAVDVASLAGMVASQGFAINGFASRPGLSWTLRGLRGANGQPVLADALNSSGEMSLYGYGLSEVTNGSWDPAVAELIAADWTKVIYGIRQDITYDLFSEGVISDDNGNVVLNLMQQSAKALRMTMRVGFQVGVPATRIGVGTTYPAGIITPPLPDTEE